MFLKKSIPKTDSLRFKYNINRTTISYPKVSSLTRDDKGARGRSKDGKITIQHKARGNRHLVPQIDYFRSYYNYDYKLQGYNWDKYRTGLYGLIKSYNNIYKYYLLPDQFHIDWYDKYINSTFYFKSSVKSRGQTFPIGWIPNNTIIYNIEKYPHYGGQLCRSAGSYGKIIGQYKHYTMVWLRSKKKITVSKYSLATVGRVSNVNHKFEQYGNAGIKRYLGIRPTVRGEAMNAVDHPNGGNTSGGKPRKNPWGKIIK